LDMKKCSRFSFEYANRDSYKRGQTKERRTGYADLRLFKEYSYTKELGVGVIHVHTDRLPSEEVVMDRILFASKATGLGPERIFVNPDCGLRTRSPEIAYRMLGLVVAGARLARREIGD
jgi:5-methyltetrahydropteroyltriglutamate--homocysteine methyltransferase